MFSSLKQNSLIHVVTRNNKLVYNECKVVDTTSSQFTNTYFNNQPNSLITLTIDVDGKEIKFGNIPANNQIAFYDNGNTIISTNKDLLSNEINKLINDSKNILNNREYYENVITDGEKILEKLNPDLADKKKRDEEITKIHQRMDNIDSKFDKILDILSKDESKKPYKL